MRKVEHGLARILFLCAKGTPLPYFSVQNIHFRLVKSGLGLSVVVGLMAKAPAALCDWGFFEVGLGGDTSSRGFSGRHTPVG